MFDLRRSPRRIKPHSFTGSIRRRPKPDLPFVPEMPAPGFELLPDTCVYIDALQGKIPAAVDTLPKVRTSSHLAVCVADLTHCFGRLDPRHPGTEAVSRSIAGVVAAIPPHRLETASAEVVIEAGILAGLVFRPCGLQTGREVAALNDTILYLHAFANGQTVLTRDVREFDVMNQILPDGRILFYDQVD